MPGADQRGHHHIGRQLSGLAHLAQFANAGAQFARQGFRQGWHVLQHRAQLIALQAARGQSLAKLHDGGGGFRRAGAGDNPGLLHRAHEGQHLIIRGANLPRRDGKAGEGIGAFANSNARLLRQRIEILIDLLGRTEGPCRGLQACE